MPQRTAGRDSPDLPPGPQLPRVLGLFDATMIVMGCIIGAGIFTTPADVAFTLKESTPILLTWVLGGAIAMTGAIVFAELGAMLPQAGGQYVFLRTTFGRTVAFLFGWLLLTAITSSAIGYVALVFVNHVETVLASLGVEAHLGSDLVRLDLSLAGHLFRPGATRAQALAAALVVTLALLNVRGLRLSASIQNVAMLAKILGVLLVIGLGLAALFMDIGEVRITPAARTTPAPDAWLSRLGLALLPIVFSYGGFQNVSATAAEVRRPERNIPLSILGGTLLIILLYVALNAALLLILGAEPLGRSLTPVADAAGAVLPFGDTLVALLVMISTAAITQVLLMVIPRIYYAMARDGVFFRAAARVHPTYQTPAVAILLQALFVILHLFAGSHLDLLQVTVLVDWTFFSLCGLALFVLRFRRPDAHRPYRALGYPVLPLVFLLLAVSIVVSGIFKAERLAVLRAAALLIVGLILFWYWSRSRSRKES